MTNTPARMAAFKALAQNAKVANEGSVSRHNVPSDPSFTTQIVSGPVTLGSRVLIMA